MIFKLRAVLGRLTNQGRKTFRESLEVVVICYFEVEIVDVAVRSGVGDEVALAAVGEGCL